jgi:hypothetical protein
MTPFNKEEYNRMCAEFLGGTLYKMEAPLNPQWFNLPFQKKGIPEGLLKFDTDWNRIMEVVDKINDPENGIMVSIHPNSCMITDNGRRGKWSLNSISNIVRVIDAKDRKEAVIQAIWEFLNQPKQD